MRTFKDESGQGWTAGVEREDTVRHHGLWYMVIRRDGVSAAPLDVPEIRWQTEATAERTLLTMSEFELRRRLQSAIIRHEQTVGPTAVEG